MRPSSTNFVLRSVRLDTAAFCRAPSKAVRTLSLWDPAAKGRGEEARKHKGERSKRGTILWFSFSVAGATGVTGQK